MLQPTESHWLGPYITFFKADKFYFFVSQSELNFYCLQPTSGVLIFPDHLKLSPKKLSLFQSVGQTNQLTSFLFSLSLGFFF